jgi:restriction system protein
MSNYTTLEIQSIALLIAFCIYFFFKLIFFIFNLRDRSLLKRNKTLKKLKRLTWDDFERLCVELFKKKGWSVKGNSKKGADGGVDIWMSKNHIFKGKVSAIVQCKRYEDSMVGIKVIREMYGLMYEYEVDEAYIVTTSRFTKECYKFVENKNMILIDGNKLVEMLN